MTEESESHSRSSDISKSASCAVMLSLFLALVYYYSPCLSGQSDFYYSDLSYFFEPFSSFVRQEIFRGICPLWNPFIYCGMSQIAVPSPGLLYLPNWLTFTLPFSQGLSIYMIFHQSIMGIGAFLYFRDLGQSRASSLFGAAALSFCVYNFSLIRNYTLPASIAWLPLALHFERIIDGHSFALPRLLGLSFCVAMTICAGRPELSLPVLLLILFASLSRPALAFIHGDRWQILQRDTVFKMLSIALGVALSLPMLCPVLTWTAVSPRAAGLALKWVFTWSANWFDFLGLFCSMPMGDLDSLAPGNVHLRQLVLSRGTHIPFLASAYLTPLVLNFAVLGLGDLKDKATRTVLVLLIVSLVMCAGSYTPFAPAFVSLSPALTVFRYPVKLLIFPCLFLIFLAVKGLDLFLRGRIELKILMALSICWSALFILAVALKLFPQLITMHLVWNEFLIRQFFSEVLQEAQQRLANSLLITGFLGLISNALLEIGMAGKIRKAYCILFLAGLCAAAMLQCALISRHLTPSGFFRQDSSLAESIKSRIETGNKSEFVFKAVLGSKASRILNLYFDPLTVPVGYQSYPGSSHAETLFQYSRELLLYQTVLCYRLASSSGYEAAESAVYKDFFSSSFALSSQNDRRISTAKATDLPVYNFALITASAFANTQALRRGNNQPRPMLDSRYFRLFRENRQLNYRIYEIVNPRPRIYLSNHIETTESTDSLKKRLCLPDEALSQRLSTQRDLCFVGISDLKKHQTEFQAINSTAQSGDNAVSLASNQPGDSGADRDFNLLKDDGQELQLDLDLDKPRLLVVADHFFPGWIAELDGKPQEIFRVNIINRGVFIPPGHHRLKMYFQPLSFYAGAIAAIISTLLFLLSHAMFCKRNSG